MKTHFVAQATGSSLTGLTVCQEIGETVLLGWSI
jgi:hypothetical protein